MSKQTSDELQCLINEIRNIPLKTVYLINASHVNNKKYNHYLGKISFVINPEIYTEETSLLFRIQTGYCVEFNDSVPNIFVQYNIVINLHNNSDESGKVGLLMSRDDLLNESIYYTCFMYPNSIGKLDKGNAIKCCEHMKYNLINKIEFDNIPVESIVYIEKEIESIDLTKIEHIEFVHDYICEIRKIIDVKIKKIENYNHQIEILNVKKYIEEEYIISIILDMTSSNIFGDLTENLTCWMKKIDHRNKMKYHDQLEKLIN